MITQKALGANIRLKRKRRYLTQEKVVELMKEKGFTCSRSILSKSENGSRAITALELVALCEVYSVSIDEITMQKQIQRGW